MKEWGRGKLEGWRVTPELGRPAEATARALLLRALDASARGDLQAEVDAWLENVDGFPAHGVIVGALQIHVADVLAIASGFELATSTCQEMARIRSGDDGYTWAHNPPGDRVAVAEPNGKGVPLYFQRAPQIPGMPWADRWMLMNDDPSKSKMTCDQKGSRMCNQEGCPEVAIVCGHEQLEEKMGVVGDVPWDMTPEEHAAKLPAPPLPGHSMTESPWGVECSTCGAEFSEDEVYEDACPGPKPEARLRACIEGGMPHMLGIDLSRPDACGTCGKTRAELEAAGATETTLAEAVEAEEKAAPDDGLVACEGECTERFRTRDTIVDGFGVRRCGPCHRIRHIKGVADSGPSAGDDHDSGSDGGKGSGEPAKNVEPRPQIFDRPRTEAENIPMRWEISCPACCSNKTTAIDPHGKLCRECLFLTPIIKLCGESAPPFDWARFLVRHGLVIDGTSNAGICKVNRDPIEPGERIWYHPKNPAATAHAGCVEEELGYVAVMIREGEVVEAELNAAAADKGEAKKEPCMVCGNTIEPGEMCYGHGPEGQRSFAHYGCVEGKAVEPPISANESRDLCEWSMKGRGQQVGDPFHAFAEVIVGSGKKAIRLCRGCRSKKPHSRLRKEVAIETEKHEPAEVTA